MNLKKFFQILATLLLWAGAITVIVMTIKTRPAEKTEEEELLDAEYRKMCGLIGDHIFNGDLIFVEAMDSGMDEAISQATYETGNASRDDNERDYSHVGMIENCSDTLFVIEAVPKAGVRRITLMEFLKANDNPHDDNPNCHIYRLRGRKNTSRQMVESYLENAKSHLGEPYDLRYLPDNGAMYCSELVYESYLDEDGGHIFRASPMNFLAQDGTLPEYWADLFSSLKSPIPQGILGTNPNDLARSEAIHEIR